MERLAISANVNAVNIQLFKYFEHYSCIQIFNYFLYNCIALIYYYIYIIVIIIMLLYYYVIIIYNAVSMSRVISIQSTYPLLKFKEITCVFTYIILSYIIFEQNFNIYG